MAKKDPDWVNLRELAKEDDVWDARQDAAGAVAVKRQCDRVYAEIRRAERYIEDYTVELGRTSDQSDHQRVKRLKKTLVDWEQRLRAAQVRHAELLRSISRAR